MTSITSSILSTNPPPPPFFLSATSSPAKLSFHPCHPPTGWSPGRRKAAQVSCWKAAHDEWLERLPDKKKPLYSHSLPCIEAWLRKLGFQPSGEDRAVWSVEKPDWHAQLSLDVTDLYIRYQKSGPGNLEKDVERRFSYALSREDIENAIRGGP